MVDQSDSLADELDNIVKIEPSSDILSYCLDNV